MNTATDSKPATPPALPSATLLAAVVEELEVLDKEIELMQLRVSECTDRATEQTLRNFGSCLWRHKKALERAIAANDRTEAQPPTATPRKETDV